jgi:uncharacterized glyoxalase superfamily protein PhnB
MSSTVIPGLQYRDAAAAIEWLCTVLGFRKHAAYHHPDGTIAHAELAHGTGMIMLGTASGKDERAVLPADIGNRYTQSIAILAEDPDAIYERVLASGAGITVPIADQPFGGRAFTCLDPEGHAWWVGSYNPWR